ncbi:MAG: 4Fe-4S dicluster domain-containing protein [Elusimicrobia bacterium]|nr:4Fe-4S dicluster domain-containing protein [Elusimicrobiota bacterium]
MKELIDKAKELLKEKKVETVIGYREIRGCVVPAYVDSPCDADCLIFDKRCVYNLANYLKWFKNKNVALVLKGCDAKSINVWLQEFQIKRENIFIIGVECYGVMNEKSADAGLSDKCGHCEAHVPNIYDAVIKHQGDKKESVQGEPFKDIQEFEKLPHDERWDFWKKQFEKCIKCYACREICPMCYCKECIVERNIPQWIMSSPSVKGNFEWNMVRAFHLAGRCVECGECERACPVNIPLMKLNKKLIKEMKELFDYSAGQKEDVKSAIDDFYPEKDIKIDDKMIR